MNSRRIAIFDPVVSGSIGKTVVAGIAGLFLTISSCFAQVQTFKVDTRSVTVQKSPTAGKDLVTLKVRIGLPLEWTISVITAVAAQADGLLRTTEMASTAEFQNVPDTGGRIKIAQIPLTFPVNRARRILFQITGKNGKGADRGGWGTSFRNSGKIYALDLTVPVIK